MNPDEPIALQHYIALDAKRMAQVLCVSERTARKLLAAEAIPSFLIGRRRLVRREDVERYIADQIDN